MRTFTLPRAVFSVCRVLVRLVALTLPLRVKKRKRLVLWKKFVAPTPNSDRVHVFSQPPQFTS